MKAYILINTAPGHALEVASKLQAIPGVVSADAITGEYDAIAVCEGADVTAVGALIVEKVQKVDGVFKTVTCLSVG